MYFNEKRYMEVYCSDKDWSIDNICFLFVSVFSKFSFKHVLFIFLQTAAPPTLPNFKSHIHSSNKSILNISWVSPPPVRQGGNAEVYRAQLKSLQSRRRNCSLERYKWIAKEERKFLLFNKQPISSVFNPTRIAIEVIGIW